jgi:hypothetical protein
MVHARHRTERHVYQMVIGWLIQQSSARNLFNNHPLEVIAHQDRGLCNQVIIKMQQFGSFLAFNWPRTETDRMLGR